MKAFVLATLALARVAIAGDWPQFRGPTGQGLSDEKKIPTSWSSTNNVLWSVPTPGEGWSSPITWNQRVFLTSTVDGGVGCQVTCLDAKTGKTLWNKRVFDQVPRRKEGKNSYATPTPATDGKRVYAVFGDGSMVALDFSGDIVWTNRTVDYYSRHGLGASPIVHDGLVIMPFDGSNRVTKAGTFPNVGDDERLGWQLPWDRSFVLALDAKTGKEVWKTSRGKSRIAHLTPLIHRHQGKTQVISCAGDAVQGFDLKTGARVWTAYSQGEGVTPNPVLTDDLVITSSGFEKTTLRAFRLGGEGDVTTSHLAWEQRKGCPTQPSLLYVKPFLHSITDGGVAHCFKPDSGEIVYAERVGGNFCTSPVHANGHIYFLGEDGTTTVIKDGGAFQVVSRNPLNGERTQASMAVSRGRLLIRTEKTLWCIGSK